MGFHEFCMQLRGYRFYKNNVEVYKFELFAKRISVKSVFEKYKAVERK